MSQIRRELNLYVSNVRDAALIPKDVLRRAAVLLGQMTVEANRKMIIDGRNRNGSKHPSPSAKWRKRKAKIIRTGLPKGYGVRKTRYAATSPNDTGRLSGRLVADLAYKNPRVKVGPNEIDFYVEIVIKSPRSEEINGYLEDLGFDMIGPPKAGTAEGRRYRTDTVRAVLDFIGANARAKGVIVETK